MATRDQHVLDSILKGAAGQVGGLLWDNPASDPPDDGAYDDGAAGALPAPDLRRRIPHGTRRTLADAGLQGADDAIVAAAARAESRAIVTENVADFAAERDLVLQFVLKKNLPAGGAQAAALAAVLDQWAHEHPNPYLGPHWPRT